MSFTTDNPAVVLTKPQRALLDAILRDDAWHEFPMRTRSQTILSLVDKKLIKLRRKEGSAISWITSSYSSAYEVMRLQ